MIKPKKHQIDLTMIKPKKHQRLADPLLQSDVVAIALVCYKDFCLSKVSLFGKTVSI